MDKGLDIDALRQLLAFHGAIFTDRDGAKRGFAAIRETFQNDASGAAGVAQIVARLRASGVKPRWDLAEAALQWAVLPRRHLIALNDVRYPSLLRETASPPIMLFVAGEPASLAQTQIAIVGARKATKPGCEFAADIAAELAAGGLGVTSGMAHGIDAAAHTGALRCGTTVAVLGCGIDRIYPARHKRLAHEIVQAGALVSEFPLGAPPLKHHFPQRNRIISGLARGTVVVEAARRSGSISTAMHALEQGREVFAVPGSVHNPMSKGCHALIRQGAKLVDCASAITDEFPDLAPLFQLPTAESNIARHIDAVIPTLGRREMDAFEACGWEPFTIDLIVSQFGLTAQEVSSMLLALELAGLIVTQASGTYVRVR